MSITPFPVLSQEIKQIHKDDLKRVKVALEINVSYMDK